MAHAWNACWVNALRGSNPLSSANDNVPARRENDGPGHYFFALAQVLAESDE